MSKLELTIEEENVECSFSVPTKCFKRLLSLFLAFLVTLLGTVGFKVELKLHRKEVPTEVLEE